MALHNFMYEINFVYRLFSISFFLLQELFQLNNFITIVKQNWRNNRKGDLSIHNWKRRSTRVRRLRDEGVIAPRWKKKEREREGKSECTYAGRVRTSTREEETTGWR